MEPEPFDPAAFERAAAAAPWVRRVVGVAAIDSTNAEALRLAAAGEPSGTVVVADAQTSGRGRLGRSWWAEPGGSLLASWLIRPELAPERWPTLTLVAGLAAARALIASAGIEVRLKWPNDLLVDERKLGGLLAEADGGGALVVGLGVNVRQTEFPDDIASIATSVVAAGGRPVERSWLLAATLSGFGARMHEPEAALEEYRTLCDTLGRSVRVERIGMEPLVGIARDLTAGGALVVESESGGRVAVAAGDVQHLR
ncbi:MAG TPA: biotin--[acetyl-CoA-carboxylase] ligase [Actinomycetota bacterium]|nr:biotin--[acetyl-CoA-carboxylase] ligase [Actinomycetota bacterium]